MIERRAGIQSCPKGLITRREFSTRVYKLQPPQCSSLNAGPVPLQSRDIPCLLSRASVVCLFSSSDEGLEFEGVSAWVGSVIGITTSYVLDGPRIEYRWGRDFPHLSRQALGPTQPPVQWVPGLSQGIKSSRCVTLTPHPLLVPWSRKSRAIPLLPYRPYSLYRASVPVQGCILPLPLPWPGCS